MINEQRCLLQKINKLQKTHQIFLRAISCTDGNNLWYKLSNRESYIIANWENNSKRYGLLLYEMVFQIPFVSSRLLVAASPTSEQKTTHNRISLDPVAATLASLTVTALLVTFQVSFLCLLKSSTYYYLFSCLHVCHTAACRVLTMNTTNRI